MKQGLFRVSENTALIPNVYKMRLEGDVGALSSPGQFINIRLDGFYSRRPISVYDSDSSSVSIVYKVVGGGTEYLSTLKAGETLDVLTGLGNGFDSSKSGSRPLLIGGGIGSAPLYGLCKALVQQGKTPTVILGFNSSSELILADSFRGLGVSVIITTADGSLGLKGFVSDAMAFMDNYTYFYACGPEAMFAAVNKAALTPGQFSYEAHMGCGFGACMSCSCKTRFGSKRVCKDGPVFERDEIIWQI